jgi:hypothetical protein
MAARRGTATRKPAARKGPRRKPSSGKTGRKKTTRKNITPRKTAPRVGARGKATRQKTASPKKITAPKRPISRPRLATANWPAKVLRWTPAKAVVTFPYRAYCWASDVAEDYRSFAASLDQ